MVSFVAGAAVKGCFSVFLLRCLQRSHQRMRKGQVVGQGIGAPGGDAERSGARNK